MDIPPNSTVLLLTATAEAEVIKAADITNAAPAADNKE